MLFHRRAHFVGAAPHDQRNIAFAGTLNGLDHVRDQRQSRHLMQHFGQAGFHACAFASS